ncbi:MAG TPA: hypothetical protein VMU54_07975 [Planctomycetota bacterium]|nr:hypothetical protein [Planctomycetota bacterium]
MRALAAVLILLASTLASCSTFGGRDSENAAAIHTVTKTYSKPADETWRAVLSVAKELDLRVETDQHDALGGMMIAKRSNKDEVHVDARSVDAQNTTVSVLVEPGDKNLAQIIQDRVSDRLGLSVGAARASLAAGSQVDGTYDQKLDACLGAAERAIAALRLAAPRRELHDTWARLETAQLDSIPIQIRLDRTRRDQTFVVFTVGTGASDDNRTLALRLKAEFERQLIPESRGEKSQ